MSRRRFVRVTGLAGAALALERLVAAQPLGPLAGGRLVKSMPLGRFDGRPAPPLGTRLGSGLDARQFTDLSRLGPDRLLIPTGQFFVRTAAPSAASEFRARATWQLDLGGGASPSPGVTLAALEKQATTQGMHLLECSGNSDPANFGLISSAEWTGVPIGWVLGRMSAGSPDDRILVSGVDDESKRSVSSVPGASWVFTPDELERAGAFLAIQMNGADLPADHGAPVRLVAPGYYGCTCIKWISRIERVSKDAPATSQMKEFAGRTNQRGVPDLAREYAAPTIDLAATPIRVEQWVVEGRAIYRVIGVRWGGQSRRVPLTIRFRHTDPFVRVDNCPDSDRTTTWSLWSHTWRPATTGRYQIVLGVQDRAIRARRLDVFYYTREVEIDRA